MSYGQILQELFWTIVLVVYYSLECLVLSLIPKRFRTRKDISREIVLITGAGHGIGRALSQRFAKLGCTVVMLDINAEWLQEARGLIEANDGNAVVHSYICDVSDRHSVYSTAKLIRKEVGNVTILVNNAGIVVAEFLVDLDDEDILKVFRTNCFAHFWTLKAFLPYMMDQNHGHIVTIASIVGKGAGGKASEYISSKFGAVGLHEAMEMELRALRRTGINMTLVCPALVDTGLFEGAVYRFPKLIPVLHADSLAADVIDAVLLNNHAVYTPLIANIAVKLKNILPHKAFDILTDFSGAATMLDNFRGQVYTTSSNTRKSSSYHGISNPVSAK